MIASVPFIERFQAIFGYLFVSEAKSLAFSARENDWTIEDCMNSHVLGHAIVLACELGILEGAPDEEVLEVIQRYSDYCPPESHPSDDQGESPG
jgi:hypothetical protein